MSGSTVEEALEVMHRAGCFYLMQRRGLRPALWRKSAHGVAPVTPRWLQAWIAENVASEVSRDLAARVLATDLAGFPVLTDASAGLV